MKMCPYCGWQFDPTNSMVPAHYFPGPEEPCPGSCQAPRNSESDKRPLWKDETILQSIKRAELQRETRERLREEDRYANEPFYSKAEYDDAIATEREACAKLADEGFESWAAAMEGAGMPDFTEAQTAANACRGLAAAIRGRAITT